MKLYLVRHGQCDSNVIDRFNIVSEDLNETGIKQVESLRDKIKDINYDIVIASPLKRTMHTAKIVNVNNKEIITDERLVERIHGTLEGVSIDSVNREEYWNYYSKTKFGTEESVFDLCKRIKDFLDELKTKNYNKVLIVAHGGVSRAFYVYFNGIPNDGSLLSLGLKNAEVKEYDL